MRRIGSARRLQPSPDLRLPGWRARLWRGGRQWRAVGGQSGGEAGWHGVDGDGGGGCGGGGDGGGGDGSNGGGERRWRRRCGSMWTGRVAAVKLRRVAEATAAVRHRWHQGRGAMAIAAALSCAAYLHRGREVSVRLWPWRRTTDVGSSRRACTRVVGGCWMGGTCDRTLALRRRERHRPPGSRR